MIEKKTAATLRSIVKIVAEDDYVCTLPSLQERPTRGKVLPTSGGLVFASRCEQLQERLLFS